MKGADIITEILINKGVNKLFGYPGGYTLDIYNSLLLHCAQIKHYLLNSEQACVFAADGYARASKKLGVVLATSGPGACNLVTGIANANYDGAPLLAITGNVPTYKLGSDSFQEVDILGVTMPITKYNHIVNNIQELPRKLIEIIDIATSGRCGATLIDIPQDIQTAELDISREELSELCHTHPAAPMGINMNTIIAAAKIINSAGKITLLIGGGCNDIKGKTLAKELALKLNLPIATTLMGVQNFDNDSPNYLGLSGIYGNPTANRSIEKCDVLITLGARFGDRLLGETDYNKKKIIQIDIDKSEHDKNIDAVCFIGGSIDNALELLLQLLHTKDDAFLSELKRYSLKVGAGDNKRQIRNMLGALASAVGKDAVVATDVGEHQIFTAQNYCFGDRFLTSGGLGAMGYGLPALIGANIAGITKKSLLITGDGSINMSLVELSTVEKMRLPMIIAIFNNHTLGMCKTAQLRDYGASYMTNTAVDIDYVKVAHALGINAHRVRDTTSLKKILANYDFLEPLVIDIIID